MGHISGHISRDWATFRWNVVWHKKNPVLSGAPVNKVWLYSLARAGHMTSRDLNLNRGVAPLPKVGFQKFFDLRDRESPICKRPLAPKYRPSTFMTLLQVDKIPVVSRNGWFIHGRNYSLQPSLKILDFFSKFWILINIFQTNQLAGYRS